MENDELDDSTVVVSRTNPSVEEATVVTSSRQLSELDDSTVVVSRTIPSVEEATVVTSSRQFTELDETTTNSGVGLISETSDVAPVPTFQPQPVVIEKPEISTVGPIQAVLDPTGIEENTRVSHLVDRNAGQRVAGDVADAVAAGLDAVHVHAGEQVHHIG